MPDGTPSIARTSGTDEASNYALSYLPGQRLSACTCPEDETHPGPKRSDGSFVGRSAPEIGGSIFCFWIS
jgi:beta-glucan synthesis-associated protein KRE6